MALKQVIGQTAKYVAPVAVITTALAYVISQWGAPSPWCRPEGLGVEVKQASAGSSYGVGKLGVKLGEAGRPIAVSAIEAGTIDVITSGERRGRLVGEPANSGAGVMTEPVALSLSDCGEVAKPASPPATSGTNPGPAVESAPLTSSASDAGNPLAHGAVEVNTAALAGPAVPAAAAISGVSVKAMRSRTDALPGSSDYSHRLLVMARAGDWKTIGGEIERLGGDARTVTNPPVATRVAQGQQPFAYAGVLEPCDDPDVLAGRLKAFRYPEFGPPVVLVTGLRGDWKRVYDVTFAALKANDKPLAALCIGRMRDAEMLVIPEFVQRYSQRCGGIIANYDVLNMDPADVQRGIDRVSLALELIHRGNPEAQAWLAVGYHRLPHWKDWIAAQNPDRFSGVALSGSVASALCSNVEAAGLVYRQMKKSIPGKPISVIGLSNVFLSETFREDTPRMRSYRDAIVDGLKKDGFAMIQIKEEDNP